MDIQRMVRVPGVEPGSQPWEGHIIAAIRYPRVLPYALASFCLVAKASADGYGCPFKNSKSEILNFWFQLPWVKMRRFAEYISGKRHPIKKEQRSVREEHKFCLITFMEPSRGFEPRTPALRKRCSSQLS